MKPSKTLAITALAVAATIGSALPASAHTASAPISKAKARSIAKAINLRASDFPGYRATPYHETASDKAEDAKFEKCVGAAPDFVSVTSPEFDNQSGYGFSSSASFVASVQTVKQDLRRSTNARAQKCIKQELAAAAAQAGASNPKVTLTRVSESSVPGLDAIFGFKFSMAFTVVGQTEHLYGYELDFGRGNAEVSLTEIGTANVAKSVCTSPLATLISRAKQQVPASGLRLAR
ncbi:MAG TPA: hypothetical protein VHB69_13050 [Mycobacteriales bacterium]|nr:hypothetical protein [Mycobacteriales bacterium]